MVPFALAAAASMPLALKLADCRSPLRCWLGLDHVETAISCANVLPEDVIPERLMPQVSRPARLARGPAKPQMLPSVQWGQSVTDMAIAIAAFQSSRVP